jgi:hypothetical protein
MLPSLASSWDKSSCLVVSFGLPSPVAEESDIVARSDPLSPGRPPYSEAAT